MRIATIMMTALIATLANLATDAMAAEEIYRWVDENGVVHFVDQPPENVKSEQITVKQSRSDAGSAAAATDPYANAPAADPQPSLGQQIADERAKKRAEYEEQKKIMEQACAQRRTIVAQLEPSPRVMVQAEDGTVTRMDDNVRLKTLDEAKTFIAKNCSN
ncbi:MAG: DUF4124 domain-containing protein [Lysobacterales bacterium]